MNTKRRWAKVLIRMPGLAFLLAWGLAALPAPAGAAEQALLPIAPAEPGLATRYGALGGTSFLPGPVWFARLALR
jgi:hypothetical protein